MCELDIRHFADIAFYKSYTEFVKNHFDHNCLESTSEYTKALYGLIHNCTVMCDEHGWKSLVFDSEGDMTAFILKYS